MSTSNTQDVKSVHQNGWLTSASYWMPAHFAVTAWHEHAPFAFWLTEATRPRTFVELGTHAGYSFFAFAEAAKRLGLSTQLFALDTWQGDDQAGFYDETVYESVRGIAERDYPETTHLLRGYFDDSVDRFENGSIDLLHVDGRHGYEDVAHDFDAYRSKLSDRAVVIFHDTFEFQEGFGVHRFWKELAEGRPSFEFEHGHGLGVLAWGDNAPEPVLQFIHDARANPDSVRSTYARLGADVLKLVETDDELRSVREELTASTAEAQQRALDHAALIAAHAALVVERDALIEQRDTLAAKEDELLAERKGILNQVQELRSSTSWKVTAPLRSVVGRIRR